MRSQRIRETSGIQTNNEWLEKRTEWDKHVTRIHAERVVKISRDNIAAGKRSPGRPKKKQQLNPWSKQTESSITSKRRLYANIEGS